MICKYRYYLLLILASTIISSCGGSNGDSIISVDNTNFEEAEPFSSEITVGNHTRFTLTGINGEVTITGVTGVNSVMINGIKRVQSESTEDANAHLQDLQVNVQNLLNEIRVDTIQPNNSRGRKYIVDYTITLPNYFNIHVTNSNGIVTLDSINNDVTVMNLNGKVIIQNILGSALVSLLNGTIDGEVTLPLNGEIDLNTLNGDVNLSIPVNTSAEFSATVSIGSINISNLALQNEITTATFLSGTLGSW